MKPNAYDLESIRCNSEEEFKDISLPIIFKPDPKIIWCITTYVQLKYYFSQNCKGNPYKK